MDIKLEIYSKGKDFRIKEYFKVLKNQYSMKRQKIPSNITNIDLVFDNNVTQHGYLKDGFIVDDTESEEYVEDEIANHHQ